MSKSSQKPKSSNKSPVKKPKPVDSYLKTQQREKSRLKKDLHTVVSHEKELYSVIYEKNKIIVEMEKGLQERDDEKLNFENTIKLLKEKNSKTLKDLSIVAENFYILEARYDKNCQIQKQENDELREKLQNQQTEENQKILELSLCCQNLEQQLQDKTQSFMKINENLLDTLRKFDKLKLAAEKQQIDFESYKKHVEEEKKIYDENYNFKLAELKNNLSHKENLIKKYVADNGNLEKEKNRIIDELNNKIHRIERAFSQPTKVVQPMISIPNNTKNDTKTNQNNTEEISNGFVHVINPQLSDPVETQLNPKQSPGNNEIKKPDNNVPKLRQYKFKRPSQHPTSLKNSNATTASTNTNNRKRQSQQNLPTPGTLRYFSTTSTDDESDDDSICQRQWRPKQPKDVCFVPDTSDASEGFAKPKRAVK